VTPARVVLVRHGAPAAGFWEDLDPGLDDAGRRQAASMADALTPPKRLVTSPLRRARETAAAVERRWELTATVEAAVSEIPSPTDDPAARGAWLREVIPARWPELDPSLQAWRARLLDTLTALPDGTVVVTHFVAINVAVGAATDADRVTCFSPTHCSATVVEVGAGALHVVRLGEQAATGIH
jgi:broad specificity phosphatase PhoE